MSGEHKCIHCGKGLTVCAMPTLGESGVAVYPRWCHLNPPPPKVGPGEVFCDSTARQQAAAWIAPTFGPGYRRLLERDGLEVLDG